MKLEDLLGVKLPIIQAPMAGIQDCSLAVAVARAGGLGSLPCAALSIEEIEAQLQSIRCATNIPINLNFFCHPTPNDDDKVESNWRALLKPYFNELNISVDSIPQRVRRESFSHDIIDVLEPYTPRIISFHFGLPARDLLIRVKAWGATILSSATTAEEALWLQGNGADLIIAQGLEAGGHRGMFLNKNLASQLSTTLLLKSVLEKVTIPVIAAGGISSSRDVTNQLNNGAIAVQIGTAYLLCNEAKTIAVHRQAIQQSKYPQTTLTNLFTGRPARAIINRVINELGPLNKNAPEFPLAATALSALRSIAEDNNSADFTPLWCGQNTQGCESISAHALTLKLSSYD